MIEKSQIKFPIDEYLPKIREMLQQNRALIIRAAPGVGKTTRVPLALMSLGLRIIMVQPRRIAARLSAEWMAEALGEKVGKRVGYQIRFDSRQTQETEILVVTEGLLTRKFLNQPLLEGYGVVILDEFHERHIHSDMALAIVKQVMQRRGDLSVVVMSATLDTTLVEKYLPGAGVLDIPGQVFPVQVEYHPLATSTSDWIKHIARKIDHISMDSRCTGHVLSFLTGKREIQRVSQKLKEIQHSREILVLTSETSASFFQRFEVISESVTILATNVAETSITLPHVTGIVDSGQSKVAGFAPWSGLPTLEVQKVSRASAIQRAGRAGRTAPGLCFRLYDEHDFWSRIEFTLPEVKRIDLTQTILEGEVIKEKISLQDFPWFESPSKSQLQSSTELLRYLGAFDQKNRLTKDGHLMSKWPLHPRLSRMIFEGKRANIPEAALLAALLLNEGIFRLDRSRLKSGIKCDIFYQIQILALNPGILRALDRGKLERILFLYEKMRSLIQAKEVNKVAECSELEFRRVIFLSFADRLAKFRAIENEGKKDERIVYHFCSGNDGILQGSSLIESPVWLVALEAEQIKDGLNEAKRTRIVAATSIEEDWLRQDPFQLIVEEQQTTMSESGEKPILRCIQYYGELILSERIQNLVDRRGMESVLLDRLNREWDQLYQNLIELKKFHQKVKILDTLDVRHQMPLFEGDYLEILKHSIVDGSKTWEEIRDKNLLDTILSLLDYQDVQCLREMFPETYSLVNGKKLKIKYTGDEDPYIEGRIQDFFGQQMNPHICNGRWPLVVKLLAPNYRPTQITRDLANFWKSSYLVIRKELRARYPRHSWPEKPEELATVIKKV